MKKLMLLLLLALPFPSLAQAASSDDPALLEPRIDSYLQDAVGQKITGCAVAVVKDGAIIFAKGYGYADLELETPVDPRSTVFEYGSISKLFTWLAVLEAARDGLLELDADITSYLPAGFFRHSVQPISMLDLMNHRPGFEEAHLDMLARSPDELLTLCESLRRSQPRQIFKPDTLTAYSNYGTALAGLIVEGVTGLPLYNYIQANFFDALGMKNSIAHPDLRWRPDLMRAKARGYSLDDGVFEEEKWFYLNDYPAGSINGTAEDLSKFAIAVLDGFSESAEFFRPSHSAGLNRPGNAHGMWIYGVSPQVYGHGGSTAGFSALLLLVPEEKLGLVLLSNTQGAGVFLHKLAEKLLRDYAEPPAQAPAPRVPIDDDPSGDYISARQTDSNFYKLFERLDPIAVRLVQPLTLEISLYGEKVVYEHIGENVYRLSGEEKIFGMPTTISIREIEGRKTIVTGSFISDYVPLEPALWVIEISFYLLVPLTGFFLLLPLVLLGIHLGEKLKRKEKGLPGRYIPALAVTGLLNGLNQVLLVLCAFYFMDSRLLKPFIGLNHVLLASWAVLLPLLPKELSKGRMRKKHAWLAAVILIFAALYQTLLLKWNFFDFP